MSSQTILWTILPHGRVEHDGQTWLRASILASPRLMPDGGEGRLADFPDWAAWTASAALIDSFEIDLDGANSLEARVVAPSPLDPNLWPRLFAPDMRVRAFAYEDFTGHTLVSFPAADALAHLRETYQVLAFASPNQPPTLDQTLEVLDPFGLDLTPDLSAQIRERLRQEQARRREPGQPLPQRPRYDAAEATARALAFHQAASKPAPPLPRRGPEMLHLFDFHKGVATLGDYGALMRMLGLVLEVEFPADRMTAFAAPGAPGRLRARPRWPDVTPLPTKQVALWTAYAWDGRTFAAAARPGPVPIQVDGMLNLSPGDYELAEVDVDGAMIKLANTAAVLSRGQASRAPDAATREAPAALRSAGFSVFRRDRALLLHDHVQTGVARNTLLQSGSDPGTFYAEDLTRGYAVDVWESLSGRWRSLFERIGDYVFTDDGATLQLRDEGFVQTALTQPAPSGGPPEARLHEAMWSWDGWSLAAPRPSRTILSGSGSGDTPERVTNTAETVLPLSVSFRAAPRSLPRLRFGAAYRMRARAVDLAGNAVSPQTAGGPAAPAQGQRNYLRFEPVAPPTVALRDPLERPGESIDRLVIRTYNADPSDDEALCAETSERHIVAPRTSVLTCEWHGMLDGPDGRVRSDAAAYAQLAARDAADLSRDAEGTPISPVPILVPPYLPDPMARGAALRDLPGSGEGVLGDATATGPLSYRTLDGAIVRPGTATRVAFHPQSEWPSLEGFRLKIQEGDAPPAWDSAARCLSVSLPKGLSADVPLSSYVSPDDLSRFGLWEWLRELIEGRSAVLGRFPTVMRELGVLTTHVAQYALEGGLWSLTPARSLRLVHAVQQPLKAPRPTLVPVRYTGETAVRLGGEVDVHGRSTGGLELQADWWEWRDDPALAGPEQRHFATHADSVPIRELSEGLLYNGQRQVGEYHPNEDVIRCLNHAFPRHEFGDTRHRNVHYRFDAISRFTDCFAPDVPGGFTRRGETFEIDVPCSAMPPPPGVQYVLPTFGWQRQIKTALTASVRLGRGLRIYLDRGWYASGDGELLGVVLRPYGAAPSDSERDEVRARYTQWGADPVFGSAALAPMPGASQFPRAVTSAEVALPDPALGSAVVAGHMVQWDEQQERWYCDIEVETGASYTPFVHLALARYQPSALDGCHLSPIVMSDFAQVAPDRTLIVTHAPEDRSRLQVVVSGHTYRTTREAAGAPASSSGSRITIEVQKRMPVLPDEFGWEAASEAVVTAAETLSEETVLWRGAVTLPASRAPGQFRVMVREFEDHPADGASPWLSEGLHAPLPWRRSVSRLVYADAVEV